MRKEMTRSTTKKGKKEEENTHGFTPPQQKQKRQKQGVYRGGLEPLHSLLSRDFLVMVILIKP